MPGKPDFEGSADMECSTSRISFTATVHVRRTTHESVLYSCFVRHLSSSRSAFSRPRSNWGGTSCRKPVSRTTWAGLKRAFAHSGEQNKRNLLTGWAHAS